MAASGSSTWLHKKRFTEELIKIFVTNIIFYYKNYLIFTNFKNVYKNINNGDVLKDYSFTFDTVTLILSLLLSTSL